MKRTAKILFLGIALFALTGCAGNADSESATDSSEKSSATESGETNTTETDGSISAGDPDESGEEQANGVSSEKTVAADPDNATSGTDAEEATDEKPLSQYSTEQIEYARVWLQLGANQELDSLYVNKIPAGTPLNPDDETSETYPEEVIQLAGARLVDGSVTYSGNGDGTINVYNVPLRWDGKYPAGEDFYKELIENTELVAIDTGDDEEVVRLIELLNVQP